MAKKNNRDNTKDKNKNKNKKVPVICGVIACAVATGAGAFLLLNKKKDTEPSVDLFKAPPQPVVPHVEPEELVEEALQTRSTPVVVTAPEEEAAPEVPAEPVEGKFVGNTGNKVFHTLDCGLGKRTAPERRVNFFTVEEAFAEDYKPCDRCKPNGTGDYVCNTDSKVFHTKDCGFSNRILPEKRYFLGTREEALAGGYKPCGRCNP